MSEARERILEERDALLDREERLLVGGIAHDSDDDAIEDRGRTANDVDMPVRDGVVRAGADGCYHLENTVIRAEP